MKQIKEIVLATGNPHKVEEINAIAAGLGIRFIMPPEGFNPVEDGVTFEENSLVKAKEANRLTGSMSLADDSGLCVDALDGAPGIYSARYADTPQKRIEKLLGALSGVEAQNRGAKFVCAMTLLDADGNILFSDRGECFGSIGFEAKGNNGFGYDPVFVVKGGNLTMAELNEEEKNKISHRAIALNKLLKFLSSL